MLEDFCLGNLSGLSFFRKDLMETVTCQSDLEEVGPCFFFVLAGLFLLVVLMILFVRKQCHCMGSVLSVMEGFPCLENRCGGLGGGRGGFGKSKGIVMFIHIGEKSASETSSTRRNDHVGMLFME